MAIFERKHVPRTQPSCHDLFEYLRKNIFEVDRFLRSLRFGRLDSFEGRSTRLWNLSGTGLVRHFAQLSERCVPRDNCEISRTRRMYNGDASVSSRETRFFVYVPLAGCACQTAFFHQPLPSSQDIFFLSFCVPRGDGTRNFNCKRWIRKDGSQLSTAIGRFER